MVDPGAAARTARYAERFKGGVFTHSFLNTYDYHRWHAPVQGTVLETRVVQALCYLDVGIEKDPASGQPIITAYDGTGYQFLQTRGIVVLDSPIGLVACIPMGMAQVSSVVFTAEVGVTLRKGEELGYFQFGGSDFVMVFERAANVRLLGTPLARRLAERPRPAGGRGSATPTPTRSSDRTSGRERSAAPSSPRRRPDVVGAPVAPCWLGGPGGGTSRC